MNHNTDTFFKDFQFLGFTGDVLIGSYHSGNTALQMTSEIDGPIATITVNLDGLKLDEVAIKSYSENEGMYEAALEQGLVHEAHRYIHSGFVLVPVCRLRTG